MNYTRSELNHKLACALRKMEEIRTSDRTEAEKARCLQELRAACECYAKIRDEKNNAIKGNLLQLAGLLAQALGIGALFMSCGYDVRTIWPELLMAVPLLICGTVTLRAGTQALAGAKPRDW
jgi:hypothetical protein